MYTYTCKECNKVFRTRKKIQNFCSLSCSSKYQYKEQGTIYPNKYFKDKKCKTCGKIFTPTHPCNLYCSKECRGFNSYYVRNYGITETERNMLQTKQNNKCAICGSEGFVLKKHPGNQKLVVDHDHKTGKVRGLLCHNCNRALGLFKDNIKVLQQAINYLS